MTYYEQFRKLVQERAKQDVIKSFLNSLKIEDVNVILLENNIKLQLYTRNVIAFDTKLRIAMYIDTAVIAELFSKQSKIQEHITKKLSTSYNQFLKLSTLVSMFENVVRILNPFEHTAQDIRDFCHKNIPSYLNYLVSVYILYETYLMDIVDIPINIRPNAYSHHSQIGYITTIAKICEVKQNLANIMIEICKMQVQADNIRYISDKELLIAHLSTCRRNIQGVSVEFNLFSKMISRFSEPVQQTYDPKHKPVTTPRSSTIGVSIVERKHIPILPAVQQIKPRVVKPRVEQLVVQQEEVVIQQSTEPPTAATAIDDEFDEAIRQLDFSPIDVGDFEEWKRNLLNSDYGQI